MSARCTHCNVARLCACGRGGVRRAEIEAAEAALTNLALRAEAEYETTIAFAGDGPVTREYAERVSRLRNAVAEVRVLLVGGKR